MRKVGKKTLAAGVLLLVTGAGGISTTTAYWGATASKLWTVPSSSNVGIGTSNPLARLHIWSGNDAETLAGRNGFLFLGGYGAPNIVIDNNEIIARNEYNPGTLHLQANGGAVHVHSKASQSDEVVIHDDGRVQIGAINAAHDDFELQVQGAIVAQEVLVTLEGWADYVFHDDYELPSLEQIEEDIQRDGHLRGIPSATEVAEQGVAVAGVTRELLARVEELTLHTIRQEKEIKALRRELRRSKKEAN